MGNQLIFERLKSPIIVTDLFKKIFSILYSLMRSYVNEKMSSGGMYTQLMYILSPLTTTQLQHSKSQRLLTYNSFLVAMRTPQPFFVDAKGALSPLNTSYFPLKNSEDNTPL